MLPLNDDLQAMAPDGRHILTGDKDDKIRVSHYPKCFDIETFCLGHKKYVVVFVVWIAGSVAACVCGSLRSLLDRSMLRFWR